MDIGIVGLGRMGGNMARRLARAGVRVVGFDPDAPTRTALASERVIDEAESIVALVHRLTPPRVVWLFRDTSTSITQRDIVLLLVLGIVCTALSHTLFIASLRRVTAHTASVVAALEPVYGIALAALLLNEIPTPRTLAGAALIIGAALHATRRDGV